MTQSKTLEIKQIFIEQAESLVKGGEVLPSVEGLAKRLQEAAETRKPLRVKLGLDPTRPDLHLGHSVVLKKLRAFQDLGHEAILIIGDATAMIGDPSGKKETRPALSREEVEQNAKTYLEQAGQILDVRKAQIIYNSQWLGKMDLAALLKLASKVTVAQLLEREDFAKRYGNQQPIYLHEMMYPLMQAYDSVEIKADIELGGTDQRFNNLLGREMQNAYGLERQQLVLLCPILEGTDGKVKMSKTYPDHCINLTDDPKDFYGKLMSIPDELIGRYELLLTPMTEEQIKEQAELMKIPTTSGGINPRDVKANLAKWLTGQFFSAEAAEKAEEAFVRQFRNRQAPDDMPKTTLSANEDYPLLQLLMELELIPSKSEGRRLVQQGGIRIDGDKVADPEHNLNKPSGEELVIQVGKRRFLKVYFN